MGRRPRHRQNPLDNTWYIPYYTDMDIDRLKEWGSSIEAELQAIRKEIQSLNTVLQRKSQQAELIRRLIESADASTPLPNPTASVSTLEVSSSLTVTPSMVKDSVYEILRDAKRPMNINEIHAEFLRRGFPIPGKGTPFNILVHIGRELKLGRRARFCRVGRGTYSLRNRSPETNR